MKSFIFIPLIFYSALLLQTSFLVHFQVFGIVLSPAVLLFLLMNVFEKRESDAGIMAAFWAGFFIDIFSDSLMGFWVAVFISASLAIRFVKEQYVRIPSI